MMVRSDEVAVLAGEALAHHRRYPDRVVSMRAARSPLASDMGIKRRVAGRRVSLAGADRQPGEIYCVYADEDLPLPPVSDQGAAASSRMAVGGVPLADGTRCSPNASRHGRNVMSSWTTTSRRPSCRLKVGERPTLSEVHSQVLQDVALRLKKAFDAFFRRLKAGETPGYPRFRGKDATIA